MPLQGVLVLPLLSCGRPTLGNVAGNVEVVGIPLGGGEVAERCGA